MTAPTAPDKAALDAERDDLQHRIERGLRGPMTVLGAIWLALLVLQLTKGLTHTLRVLGTLIWIAFILDFLLRLWIAPDRKTFLRHNWLTTIALVIPAVRVLQFVRIFRALAGGSELSILQIVGTLNRSMNALSATLGRRGFKYVALLTLVVTVLGAAGMLGFERDVPASNGLHRYGDALYWTIMLITTIGSEYWPHTAGGKILTVLLSLYGVAILGYIAGSLATFFIDRDADNTQAAVAGEKSVQQVLAEVRALRELIEKQAAGGSGGR